MLDHTVVAVVCVSQGTISWPLYLSGYKAQGDSGLRQTSPLFKCKSCSSASEWHWVFCYNLVTGTLASTQRLPCSTTVNLPLSVPRYNDMYIGKIKRPF